MTASADERQRDRLAILLDVIQVMSAETDFDRLLQLIMAETTRALDADRSTLFLLDADRGELWSKVAQGLESQVIRIPSHVGVAGYVASTGEVLNIPAAYDDPRFNPAVDRRTGYRTRNILCVPAKNKAGEIIGVLQVLNKQEGIFSGEDEEFVLALASQAAIAVENARLYAALREANAELQKLDQLKSQFLANISHELRTPLSPIIGYVDLLLSGAAGALSEAQRSGLEVVGQAVERLRLLIEDLLAFVQLDKGEVVVARLPVELASLLDDEMRPFAQRATEKGVAFQVEVTEALVVWADPQQLGRVLALLADNAVKFTPAEGSVTVSARRVPPDALPSLGQDPQPLVEISVQDTGIGIPEDQFERIFDRFYQIDGSTTRQFGGMGMGLAVAKLIVEAHGSALELVSQVGKGSTFRFRLPERGGS